MNVRRAVTMATLALLFTSVSGAAENEDVIIGVDSTNLQFSPSDVTITEGQAVRFFWSGELLAHNAVSTDGLFDSGNPSRNVDYRFVFDVGTNGTYEFVCEPHEQLGMIGTITVQPTDQTQADPVNETISSSTQVEDTFRLTFFGLELIILSFIAFFIYQVGKIRERGTPVFVKSTEEMDE